MSKILVVEDDAVIARIYQGLLRLEGHETEVAQDGVQALNCLAASRPDLVLLDLMLPIKNGIEVLKHIRAKAELKHLPVIVFTNAYMGSLMREALQQGATHCLAKTTPPKQVVHAVSGYLGLKTPGLAPSAAVRTRPTDSPERQPAAVSQDTARLLSRISQCVPFLRKELQALARSSNDAERRSHLAELRLGLSSSTPSPEVAQPPAVPQILAVLKLLTADLDQQMQKDLGTILRTFAHGVDCLAALLGKAERGQLSPWETPLVFLLDPDPASRLLIEEIFAQVGLRCLALSDPQVAVGVLRGNRFDLLVLDVGVGNAKEFEFCRELRKAEYHKTTPMIIITRLPNVQVRALSIMSGANDFIQKPFFPAELAARALIHVLNARLRPHCPTAEQPSPAFARTSQKQELSTPAAI